MLASPVGQIALCGNMLWITISRWLRRTHATSSNSLTFAAHPGLIVLRESGLSRQEQWERVHPVLDYVQSSEGQDFLLNKLVEGTGVGEFRVREIPAS